MQEKQKKKNSDLSVEQISKLETLREKIVDFELEWEEKLNQEMEQENIIKELDQKKEQEKDNELILDETKIIDNTTQFNRIRDWIKNFKYIDIITKQSTEMPSDLDEIS